MPPPAAATITIRATLDLLDGPFADFAKGVSEGRYAFWLGSGISLDRVPGLKSVIEKVIEFIRSRIDATNTACKFAKAMQDVFQMAPVSADEQAVIDLSTPVSTWPQRDEIISRLVNNYARLLGIAIPNEDFDILVWDGIDVPNVYGNPALQPDVEHLCIAALSLEGVASDLASANWDCLVERAVADLTNNNPALLPTVVARPADIQLLRNRTRLLKFHGCAGKAAENPADFRAWLVATHDQINGWCARIENAPFVTALVGLISSKPTLMLGLSAQDNNIQHIFQRSATELAWRLETNPLSYVFSENQLGSDQQALLRNVYRNQITPDNMTAVFEASRIQAYAKPLLTALLLDVLCKKLQALILLTPGPFPQSERQQLIDGVRTLRDSLASAAQPSVEFINALLNRFGRASKLLREGQVVSPAVRYQAISAEPVPGLPGIVDLNNSGLAEAAVALGLLGVGHARGDWVVDTEPMTTDSGMLAVTVAATPRTKLFVTANAYTATLLRSDGHLIEAQLPLVVQAKALATALPRSPRTAAGRTGRALIREVSVAELLNSVTSFDELYSRFRGELSL